MTAGIYSVRNLVTGFEYVGSSRKREARLNQHRQALMKGAHPCVKLQAAWNLHGEQNFRFMYLEETSRSRRILLSREQSWIDKALKKGRLYNTSPKAIGGGGTGPRSEATKQRQRDAWARRRKLGTDKPSKETCARMSRSATRRANTKTGKAHLTKLSHQLAKDPKRQKANSRYQKRLAKTRAGKARLRALTEAATKANTGKCRSLETRRKQSLAHKRLRKHTPFSAEHLANLAKAQRRRYRDPEQRAILHASGEKGRRIRSIKARRQLPAPPAIPTRPPAR
jgi:group I intron endonuclease